MKYQVNEKLFQKADTFFVVNDHDEDLQEEKIFLPEPPSYKKIAGYNLPIKEQKWRAPEHPKKLLELEHKFQAIDEIWDYLYQNQHDYKEEINWIRQQWNYRLNGYWFFNNGKPTFIDGWHYFYLAYWQMDIGLPDYRDRDRRWFLFARHCATTTKDFYGNDYGRRTCFGFLYPKHRRDGATHKSLSILFDIASRTQNSECGIQSFDDDNAREHFRKKLMYAFLKMPFFFKPRWDGSSNPKKALAFMSPAIKGGTGSLLSKGIELSSFITYATTADRKFYEGKKLQMYLAEEQGKTVQEDVYARWQTMKETLAQGSGGKIHGFSIHPTTVYDMEAGGGQRYYDLCKDSLQYVQKEINPLSGQTKTGLRVLFIPAYDGLEGFIDEYGYSVIDKPTKEQAKFIKQNHGARHHLESQRKLYLDEGTPKAISSYNKLLSNYPISFAECFRVLGGENNGFNFSILDKRIAELRREEYASKIVMGNFEWEGGILDSKVAWVPDNSGKFIVTKLLKEGEHNQRILQDETYMPEHAGKFVASADVYQWSQEEYKKSNESSRGVSDGGGAVYWDRDFSIDPEDKDISTWESGVFACTYQNRPSTVDEYCEDMIKMCVYYGAMMFPEVNIRTVWEYFVKRGYEGYLLYDFDSKGVMRTHPGFASNTASKQELFNFVRDHIQWHGHRELQLPFLEDCKKIRGLKDMTNYDRWTACAGCLYAARKVPRDMYRDNSKPVDINDFFNLHSY